MHVLFIIDPLANLKAYKDTSVAMMMALQTRGHRVSVCLQSDLCIDRGQVLARALPISIPSEADLHGHGWWRTHSVATDQNITSFDAVVMRKDPPFDMEYVYATHLLEFAQTKGAKVFNSGAAIRNHPEKLSITEFPQFTVPTLVTSDSGRLKDFYQQYEDVVFKPLDGMGGAGIFRARKPEVNLSSILELLTHNGRQTIMAQRYIPEIAEGDKRIIVIDGEPIPYVLARIPSSGETRGNLAAGGRGVAQPISAREREIAKVVGATLRQRGLLLLGIDVIGNYLTEINVTSPTCFVEIKEQTGFDVAEHFAIALEKVAVQ